MEKKTSFLTNLKRWGWKWIIAVLFVIGYSLYQYFIEKDPKAATIGYVVATIVTAAILFYTAFETKKQNKGK